MSKEISFTWAKVLVNGKNYGIHPVEITAQAGNDLPGRLNFNSGITQRTGTIYWDAESEKHLIINPMSRKGKDGFLLPSHGDRIQIIMGKQDTDPKLTGFIAGELVFTGKVDYTQTTHTGEITTHIVDEIDRLNHIVRFPAFKHHMPPSADTKIGWYLHNGITPDTILGWIAARCGYHMTPPPQGHVYLSVGMNGSTLTSQNSYGRLSNSQRVRGDTYNLPLFTRTSRGLALAQGHCDYVAGSQTPPKRLVISGMVGASHTGEAVIYANLSNQAHLRVVIGADRKVWAMVGDTRLGSITPGPDAYFSASFTEDGSVSMVTKGQRADLSFPTWTTAQVGGISVDASAGSAIAGINVVGFTTVSDYHPALAFQQSAFIDCGYHYPLHLSRSIRDEKAIDVIKEICQAICCLCYLDGEGNLTITYGRTAYRAPISGTLTAREDIRGFSIKDDSQLAAYRTIIKYETVDPQFTNRSHGSYVTLWEAPSTKLEAGETIEHFIAAGADEEFFEVDAALTYANASDQARADFNAGNGSFAGYMSTNGTTEWWSGGRSYLETITPWAYKLTLTPDNASTTCVPEVQTVKASRWGAGMPVIRCGAKVTRVDAEPYIASGGNASAADLTHEAGPWVTATRAQDIGDLAMSMAKEPLPVITNLACFFDPAIAPGQRWTIDLSEIAGFKATCLILGVTHDPAADLSSIDVRLLSPIAVWNWGKLAETYSSFAQVETDFATYSALEKGP